MEHVRSIVRGATVLFAYALYVCTKNGQWSSNWIYLFSTYVPQVVGAGKETLMSSATTISVEHASGTPEVNPWLIGVVVSLAAFMEVLDTSIANVALPHIAGNLGASNDESTWVLTSYLVSNAIVLPISGFLVGLLVTGSSNLLKLGDADGLF